jgi:hypothetical protein
LAAQISTSSAMHATEAVARPPRTVSSAGPTSSDPNGSTPTSANSRQRR